MRKIIREKLIWPRYKHAPRYIWILPCTGLRLKAAATHRSISDIVADAVRESLREDEEDLSAVAQRVNEPSLAYEAFLAQLKADGTL
ncbi:hypothetical protein GPA27_24175 [Aromatoleum toluolicum]|uniref:hypothetical protein n=1 Tax=Aromatoleum toluolicum TaxID=90060 RepID=UPI001B7D1956|nr:hypothetical protein [Aromatoleum toluolicum]MCQ6964039.1 hypothetical protein [Aromatoleum toluolicum]